MLNVNGIGISWNGHDGFRLDTGNKLLYIDPFKLTQQYSNKNDADIILITHNHYDHLSVEDINNIIKESTIIICSSECTETLNKNYSNKVIPLKPQGTVEIDNVKVTAIEAYNTNKKFHPKDEHNIGYLIHINGLTIYHTGDTDLIPEMNNLNPDIAFVPVSGTYVMTAEEASKAVNELIKPKKLAIPMHYNSIVGSVKDAEVFCDKIHVCKTIIMNRE